MSYEPPWQDPASQPPPPPQWGPPPSGQAPPPPPYGQPPYGAPQYQQYGPAPYGGAPANPFESRATPILVLGICGLVLCQILAPVAWFMGRGLKRDAEAAGWPEPGTAKAGRICGIVGTCLIAAFILIYAIIAIAFFATAAGRS